MQLCICDDEQNIHDEIRLLLQPLATAQTEFTVADFFSGEDLVEQYSAEKRFDIIFLDVEMGNLSGIETAEKIRQIDPNAIIIFVSSHESYVFDVFRLEALHFIRKPINQNEFSEVLQRAMNKYRSLNSSITLKRQGERINITINDIVYVEGYKRHITVHTKDEAYETIGKVPDLLKTLEPHGFIQIHQGFIVNMDCIKRFDAADVVLRDGTKVMLSVRKRPEALKAYDSYIQKRKW